MYVFVSISLFRVLCLQAVEGQAAAHAQQSSSLTTLVLHLMVVQNFHLQ